MSSESQHWPFLLFLPRNNEDRQRFIKSVLGSRVAESVLSSFDHSGMAYQRDLVENLNHSNKSIIAYLKTLKEYGLIQSSSVVREGKRVVYHELTRSGWGLARFFSEGLPSDLGELTSFLLEDYLTHLIALYREEKMPDDIIFEIFNRTRAKAALEGSKTHEQPEFTLFGASAFLTEIQCDEIPARGAVSSCSSPNRYPGGPTADLASILAEDGHRVTFVSSVGNDKDGWRVVSDLIGKGVDVADLVVENGKTTNESFIVKDKKGERTMVGIGESTSLSITSPSQVPWAKVTNSSVVYIGEVFLEVAVSIAAYAKSRGIPVVYRPSIPYLEMGLEATEPVLKQVDLLMLSTRAWHYLPLHYGPRPIERIHSLTDATALVKKSKKAYSIHAKGKRQRTVQCQRATADISSPFVMGLLQGLKSKFDLEEAVNLGIALESSKNEELAT